MITNETIFEEYLALNQIRPAIIKVQSYDSDSQISSIGELASSIKTHGLLQPILVRPKVDYFEIVAGHRRYLDL